MNPILEQAAKGTDLALMRSTEISGREYKVRLLPTTIGVKVQERIFGTFLPSLGVAFDNFEDGFNRIFTEDTPFTDLAMAIAANASSLGLTDMLKDLLNGAYCDGQAIDYETHFAGNYGDLALVVAFALKENFGDAFQKVLKGLEAAGLEIPTLGTLVQGLSSTGNPEE